MVTNLNTISSILTTFTHFNKSDTRSLLPLGSVINLLPIYLGKLLLRPMQLLERHSVAWDIAATADTWTHSALVPSDITYKISAYMLL